MARITKADQGIAKTLIDIYGTLKKSKIHTLMAFYPVLDAALRDDKHAKLVVNALMSEDVIHDYPALPFAEEVAIRIIADRNLRF